MHTPTPPKKKIMFRGVLYVNSLSTENAQTDNHTPTPTQTANYYRLRHCAIARKMGAFLATARKG